MGDIGTKCAQNGAKAKKQILLNAFDMSTVGHLSPGQWKVRHTESHRTAKGRIENTNIPRTLSINPLQSATSSTGLNWLDCSNVVVSMPSSWLIHMVAMIRMRTNWMNVFDGQRSGQ